MVFIRNTCIDLHVQWYEKDTIIIGKQERHGDI